MSSYKEIVTKAVLGKGKKSFVTSHTVTPSCVPTTILGCWVINHNFRGYKVEDKINLEGSFDVNIWYSCENDSKTEVIKERNNYLETVVVNKRESTDLGSEEIIVRSLKQPSCVKAEIVDGKIVYTIEKELGIEIVGDTKVKIQYDEDEEPWEDLLTNDSEETNVEIEEIEKEIDEEVKEDYI